MTAGGKRPGAGRKKGSKPGGSPKAAKKAQNVITDKENRRRTSVTGVKHRRKKPGEGKGFFDKKVIKY